MDRDEHKDLMILKQAVENAVEGFVTIDQDHQVVFFNRAAERIFGYAKDEVLGKDLGVIMSPACSADHRAAVNRYIRTGIPSRIGHETEMTAVHKSGEVFPALISFSVIELDGRRYFTGIVRDLTETRILQEQLIHSERLAALGQSVAEITHEIKNPLALIGGFARQLQRTVNDEKGRQKLNIITDEIARLEKLLAELRDFHLISSLTLEKVDLENLLEEVLSLLKKDCGDRRVEIRLQVDEGAKYVTADPEKLKQVLLNLFKNSMDAMASGGVLTIAARGAGENVEIGVSDNGCGIPEADRDSIFSPFFTTKDHGTGLGLAISKRIVEQHPGGALTLESGEGKGTTFTVTLPSCGHVQEGPA